MSQGEIKRTNGWPYLPRASAEGRAPLFHLSLVTWGGGLGLADIGFRFLFSIRAQEQGGQIAKSKGGGRHALESEVTASGWPRINPGFILPSWDTWAPLFGYRHREEPSHIRAGSQLLCSPAAHVDSCRPSAQPSGASENSTPPRQKQHPLV